MTTLAETLVAWQRQAGRHDLPWQQPITPYFTWISEIMLQQTQVNTVIPYFLKFIASFPDVDSLAQASQEAVLAHWSGLGYYARARNLHKAAQLMVAQHAGKVPANFEDLLALPGIGRSTAGAILAISHQLPYPILDGNAKRVLLRYHGIFDPPDKSDTLKQLWQLAESHTPNTDVDIYTQAVMDLGAGICTRSRPNCSACPLQTDCQAHQQQATAEIPAAKSRRRSLPTRHCQLVILRHQQQLLLIKRPSNGIWGGLWCFPQLAEANELAAELPQHLNDIQIEATVSLTAFKHTFTHFHLQIQPVLVELANSCVRLETDTTKTWQPLDKAVKLGIPKPVARLLAQLQAEPQP